MHRGRRYSADRMIDALRDEGISGIRPRSTSESGPVGAIIFRHVDQAVVQLGCPGEAIGECDSTDFPSLCVKSAKKLSTNVNGSDF